MLIMGMLIGLDGRLRGRRMFDFRLLAVVFCACLMVFAQGAQGAASLAPGYALHWAFSPTLLSWKQARLRAVGCASRWFLTLMAANGR